MSETSNGCTAEEKQLVDACMSGDRLALKRLYDTYAQRMMPICVRYTNDYESAKDLLHDGFLKVFSHLGDYRGQGSFDGWMRRIFVNTALEQLRKLTDRPYMVDVEEARSLSSLDVSVLDKMSMQEILDCIQLLPESYRAVFNMAVLDDYSHREIAEQLGITESSSRVYLMRAKQQLQEMLSKRMK